MESNERCFTVYHKNKSGIRVVEKVVWLYSNKVDAAVVFNIRNRSCY